MMNYNPINTNISNRGANLTSNYGYVNGENFFTKKAEDFNLPEIDLEFNNTSAIQEATFSRMT